MPTAAYSSGPSSASTASWAKVSVFDSRVGRPYTPLSPERTLRPGGSPISPLTARTSAPSPETNRSSIAATRTSPVRPRSATAAVTEASASSPAPTATTTSREPSALAASRAPSSTRCGARVSRVLSFRLAGSPSAAFTSTTVSPSRADTARSLRANGNAAPTRPRRSTSSVIEMSASTVWPGSRSWYL